MAILFAGLRIRVLWELFFSLIDPQLYNWN